MAVGPRSAERSQLHLLSGAMNEHGLLTRSTIGGLPRRGILNNDHLALFVRQLFARHTWAGYGNTEPLGTNDGALGENSLTMPPARRGWYGWTAMFWPSTSAQCMDSSASRASSSLQNSITPVSLPNGACVRTEARAPNGRKRS